ncbi:MAG: VCBS repeat-containing protein, partial [Fuerstiella sp.]|nr:VCBS repeat-containing protein [Fuerstiella sp.]
MMLDLGVAWLRVAETENCINCQTGESCILPIGPGGLHRLQEGSRQSIKVLTSLLTQEPENYSARWLLNVAAMTVGEYPEEVPEPWRISPSVFQSQSSFPKFDNIAAGLGLGTVDLSGGVIIEDFDNDGWLDIVTSTWDTSSAMHYFRNNGDGSFTDRTQEAGLADSLGGLNMIQADYDNDG